MNNIKLGFILIILSTIGYGQTNTFVTHPNQLEDDSFADWIVPLGNGNGVFYFRKTFDLKSVPNKFVVHVSADARYRLYVNGQLVSWGPSVGDMQNWNYESVDLAPYLKSGKNLIASQVWNREDQNGARQISKRTAFILQGETENEQRVNTNGSWRVAKDEGYQAVEMNSHIVGGGYIAGGTDHWDAQKHPWDWNQLSFNDAHWENAQEAGKGIHIQLDTWIGTPWHLRERAIPAMEQKDEKIAKVVDIKGIPFPVTQSDQLQFEIPANTHVEILLDNEVLTMGFPQLLVEGGANSQIKIQYQEGLFQADGKKGNRNEWEGKTMKGYYDVFTLDGGKRHFQPLWIRVFRYAKLTIDTKEEDLKIIDYYNKFTAYPLKQIASFESDNSSLKKIWDTSWRTARLCAYESYMDCPYYEQLQYIGDTRIQALISMYISGDDRLTRNALKQFYSSIQPMGLTKSAHPTEGTQIIPPFSLIYISMIHDYYMLRDDPEFVKQFLPGIKFILEWYINKIDANGMLGSLPYWNHIDGGTDFINGSPPGVSEGGSAHISLLLANSLGHAAEILEDYGYLCDSDRYRALAETLKISVLDLCFDPSKGLIAETSAKEKFSQHTNAIAILTDLFDREQEKQIAQRTIEDVSLIKASLYFKFYLFQALNKAGLGGELIGLMNEWESFLDYGFTTFPEHGINSRSDCHAWSAHPMYDIMTITCGIAPASPGFKTVEIRPNLGTLSNVSGRMPHPLGTISTNYKRLNNGKLECVIILPEQLTGELKYKGKSYQLVPGQNQYEI